MTAGGKLSDNANSGRNEDFDWSHFDAEAYFQHYYGEPHPDDDQVIRRACAALIHAEPKRRKLSVVDVGTGPNLFPMMLALPRASHLTAWEISDSNVAWLKSELAADIMRPQWRHFWNVVVESYGSDGGLPEDPRPRIRKIARIARGSVYELPERRWDAATMFFCAESITGDRGQFGRACASFSRCVRPGGTLVAAFLVGSSSYVVADRPFPILNISETEIHDVFASISREPQTERIGIVQREIRSGYSGMVFMVATAR
jgi:SAM-dependent methyltransferase